jgi:aminopeptidase-like protein
MKQELESYFDRLWPICRSITGDGVRETLRIISEIIPLNIHEVPSGTKVFDWEVPKEWYINDAYILTPEGKKIANFKINNLHILNYSIGINKNINYSELKDHLFTIESMPEAIPYVTSYYKEKWGFCISHNEFLSLPKEGEYHVVIDAGHKEGSLTYADLILPGDSEEEIMFSTYVCHPSMANNELSGPLTLAFLYREILKLKSRKYTYRFIFIPETIGAISYLAENGRHMKEKTAAGFVLTCCGDNGEFHYKKSRRGNSLPDRAVTHYFDKVIKHGQIRPFKTDGSDERQYCSPGFNLPVGSLMRTPYYEYAQYHTSFDNKSFISFEALEGTVQAYLSVIELLELNDTFVNTLMYCEPQLGRRGLYPTSLTHGTSRDFIDRLLHLVNYCDGEYDLIEIANLFDTSIFTFKEALDACLKEGLLVKKSPL